MSTIVQATCPGCRNVLRIPADWLKTPLRCKHCQTVLMPRKPVSDRTPAPGKKKTPPPLVPGADSPRAGARKLPPLPPLPHEVVPASEMPPVAVADPAPTTGKKKRGNAFAELDGDETPADRVRQRRPRRGGFLVPFLVMCVLLGGAASAVFMYWPQIKAALNGDPAPAVAENDKPARPVKPAPEGAKDRSPGTKDAGSKDSAVRKDMGKKDRTASKDGPPPRDPTPPGIAYPRRGLVISIHNYLYANPIHTGDFKGQTIADLVNKLNGPGTHMPLTQVAHLSDAAGRGAARFPTKPVIEKTLTDFTATCRGQDCIMVFLIGHVAEIEDKEYFVPIDGDFEDAAGLIPMTWILEKMSKCPARQKILVVDVNRENPISGHERPASGPMSAKLEALLKAPPEGVQIWSACSKDGFSYEPQSQSAGIFVESVIKQLGRGTPGKILRPADLIPLEALNELVNSKMKADLAGEAGNLKQVAFVAGKVKDNGFAYNPKEAAPPGPVLAPMPGVQSAANKAAIEALVADIKVPPIKATKGDSAINWGMFPPMMGALTDYAPGGETTKVREKIKAARAVLWAVQDPAQAPADLKALVTAKTKELKVTLSLRAGYNVPSNEAQFKTRVEGDERQIAIILGALTEAHDDLKDLSEMKEKETKRWQMNYDYIVAHLEAEIAYLYEYQSMLGQMRKELPTYDPKVHHSFQLASRGELTGDSTGKKMAKSSGKTLTALAETVKGTPWEVLARREKITSLGLEWKPSAESVSGR